MVGSPTRNVHGGLIMSWLNVKTPPADNEPTKSFRQVKPERVASRTRCP